MSTADDVQAALILELGPRWWSYASWERVASLEAMVAVWLWDGFLAGQYRG